MHWVGLVVGADHVCCRYRLGAFKAFWEAAGHTLELHALQKGPLARMRQLWSLGGANVILQRRLLPGWQLAALRRAAARLVFDFDDAVFLRDSYSRRGLHDARRLGRFAATVRAADAVVAGNSFLHSHASLYAEGRLMHVIPTCVSPRAYPLAQHDRSSPTARLVWIGSSSTLQGLAQAEPILDELGGKLPGLDLKIICDQFLPTRQLPVVPCRWSQESEAEAIAEADIGISWAPDDLWSRGKCGLKVLQYMAAGLPVVANPVGVHTEIVADGETGFLAQTPSEWSQAVRRLAQDPALRRRMGLAGRRRVEANYDVAQGARQWLELFEQLSPQTALRSTA